MQKKEVGSLSYNGHKRNLKWIEELRIRAKTIKHLEENREFNLHNLGFDNAFLDMTSKAQETQEKNR